MDTALTCSLSTLKNADWGALWCCISGLPWMCWMQTPTPSVTLTANQLASQSGGSMSEKWRLVAWCLVEHKVRTPAVCWEADGRYQSVSCITSQVQVKSKLVLRLWSASPEKWFYKLLIVGKDHPPTLLTVSQATRQQACHRLRSRFRTTLSSM